MTPLFQDKESVRILDIAAASGEPTLSLAKALPNATFVATDIAEAYAVLAQQRVEAEGFQNITFEQADGESLEQYPDASFDAVTCSLGLMFFDDERKGLSEFYRVLKPGGTLAVTVWSHNVPFFELSVKAAEQLGPLENGESQTPVNTAMRFGDAKNLLKTFEDVGFVESKHHQFEVTFRLSGEGPDGWWGRMWRTPFPLKAAVSRAINQGCEPAEAITKAKALLEKEYNSVNYISENGDLVASNNYCNFLMGTKPGN